MIVVKGICLCQAFKVLVFVLKCILFFILHYIVINYIYKKKVQLLLLCVCWKLNYCRLKLFV